MKSKSTTSQEQIHFTNALHEDSWSDITSYELYKLIFEDQELIFVPKLATVIFLIASTIAILCLNTSIKSCPYIYRSLRNYGNEGHITMFVIDCLTKTALWLGSVFMIWMPLNRSLHLLVSSPERLLFMKPKVVASSKPSPALSYCSVFLSVIVMLLALLLAWKSLKSWWIEVSKPQKSEDVTDMQSGDDSSEEDTEGEEEERYVMIFTCTSEPQRKRKKKKGSSCWSKKRR